MEIKYFCPIWGMRDLPLSQALKKIKAANYQGAEIGVNPDRDNLEQLKSLFEEYQLEMIVQFSYAKGNSFEEELEDYKNKLNKIVVLNPKLINSHTGRDYFTTEQNIAFLKQANQIEKESGITISHEIHRGRFSYSPSQIETYLDVVPNLKLSADFSHWCVVSESLLENFKNVLDRVIPNCEFIHARVGNTQASQVNHPFAPENKTTLNAHVSWWQRIIDEKKRNQINTVNITCEFGPSPYMPSIPFTNEPIASQWEVNLAMKAFLQDELTR